MAKPLITNEKMHLLFADVCEAFDSEHTRSEHTHDAICSQLSSLRRLVTPRGYLVSINFYHANIYATSYHEKIMELLQSESVRAVHPEFATAYGKFASALNEYVEYVKSTLGSTNGHY